jgi:hypothetical protein
MNASPIFIAILTVSPVCVELLRLLASGAQLSFARVEWI